LPVIQDPSKNLVNDRTTLWHFKERMIKAGDSESVFEAVNRRLAKHVLICREN